MARRKAAGTSSSKAGSSFEAALMDYVSALRMPLQAAKQALAVIAEHDFSSARAHLIASVPGYHTGTVGILWNCIKMKLQVLGCLPPCLKLRRIRMWSETCCCTATVSCEVFASVRL